VAGAPEAEDSARAAGLALRRLGVDAVLGPVASRALAGGPWEDRGFAEEPGEVAQRAGAAVRGWQQGGVLAVPGRFPGEGAASQDPSDGPASVALGRPELEADLGVFRALGPRVVATQMSGALYAAFDGVTPATLLPDAVALLREVDPDAIAVSADLQAVTLTTGGTVADAAVAALEAGCDLLYVPGDAADQEAAFRAVVTAIRSGRVPGDRVAEALQRVAALKRAARVVRTG
jgi:beta-N-acetylhexosaminidase